MKKLFKKDKKKRKIFYKFEILKFILKNIFENKNYLYFIRLNACFKLFLFNKNTNRIRMNKRCIFSFRKNICNNKFKFSRLFLLNLIRNGFIYGARKIA